MKPSEVKGRIVLFVRSVLYLLVYGRKYFWFQNLLLRSVWNKKYMGSARTRINSEYSDIIFFHFFSLQVLVLTLVPTPETNNYFTGTIHSKVSVINTRRYFDF